MDFTMPKPSAFFIRGFQDRVDWESFSNYQDLSKDFIQEFQYTEHWYLI